MPTPSKLVNTTVAGLTGQRLEKGGRVVRSVHADNSHDAMRAVVEETFPRCTLHLNTHICEGGWMADVVSKSGRDRRQNAVRGIYGSIVIYATKE